MNIMKRISLIIISAFLILLVTEYCVVASCLPPNHPLTELELSDFVISGIVVSVDDFEPGTKKHTGQTTHNVNRNNLVRWRIQVKDVWKGTVSDTIDVFFARMSASRGYEFAVGKKYLIYGRIIKNKSEIGPWSLPEGTEFPVFKTNACTRTREYGGATEDIYFLPEPVYSYYADSRPN